MEEKELLQRIIQKDPLALEAFYVQYRSSILSVARRMVHDEWDAEEVLQDVVWTVHRKAHTFRGDTNFWPWVYRVTQNAARMQLRKTRRVPIPCEAQDIESMINASNHSPSNPHPENTAVHRETLQQMQLELNNFDEINQDLFRSMEFNGDAKEDVAARLGLSVPAVKARLHRIRKALRGSVQERLPA